MNVAKIIRITFHVLVFGIFAFQMQNSLRKYIDKPVVSQLSKKTIDQITKPIIYICQNAQFNYAKARANGYNYFSHFTTGKVADQEGITWKGKYGNTSFQKLKENIFEYDYSNFFTEVTETVEDSKFKPVDTELMFMIPFGYCRRLYETQVGLLALSTESNVVILVDPYKENNIWIPDIHRGRFEFGPTEIGVETGLIYLVELEIHDLKLHKDETCTDYESIGSSYGECVEKIMADNFLQWYGCLPPWVKDSTGLVCEIDKEC